MLPMLLDTFVTYDPGCSCSRSLSEGPDKDAISLRVRT